MYSFLIKYANVNIVVYGNLMVESNLTIRPVVKEVITSHHVITWRYLLTLLPFKQLNERTLMYIYYKALSFGTNVRIKNFSFFFF